MRVLLSLAIGALASLSLWLWTITYGPHVGWESGSNLASPFYAFVMLAIAFAAYGYTSHKEEE